LADYELGLTLDTAESETEYLSKKAEIEKRIREKRKAMEKQLPRFRLYASR
jgi:excinuclease ABC subunit B